MSEHVTDADRKTAVNVAAAIIDGDETTHSMVTVIAAALAAEREKARAPFLALTEELAGWQNNAVRYAAHAREDSTTAAMARARAMAYGRAIDAIRRAAEEGQQ